MKKSLLVVTAIFSFNLQSVFKVSASWLDLREALETIYEAEKVSLSPILKAMNPDDTSLEKIEENHLDEARNVVEETIDKASQNKKSWSNFLRLNLSFLIEGKAKTAELKENDLANEEITPRTESKIARFCRTEALGRWLNSRQGSLSPRE